MGLSTTKSSAQLQPQLEAAELVLADGTCFSGVAVGAPGKTSGEVVFNTAMTGYQEILTDPSYCEQIVTLTYPHIGNTGTCFADNESITAQAAGLIIRDLPVRASNWRSNVDLSSWLQNNAVVAIAELDTRQLTRHLRTHGAMGGAIVTEQAATQSTTQTSTGKNSTAPAIRQAALLAAQEFPGLAGMDLAQRVSCTESYPWTEGTWTLETDRGQEHASDTLPHHVVAMDFGVKHNILRMLVDRGCRVTVVPAAISAADILALQPDGVFLSNGPGDPEPCVYAIETIRSLLGTSVAGRPLPIFGICLGHQLLALASGAKTLKMKFGHHGANHPVLDHASGKVMISSQNHGFAVDPESLGNHLKITHTSLFDGTLQGIERVDVPAFGFQGHPEASPGPHDVASLFDRFTALL